MGNRVDLTSTQMPRVQVKADRDAVPRHVTAEQLLAQPLYGMADVALRRDVAAKFAVKGLVMSDFFDEETRMDRAAEPLRDWTVASSIPTAPFEDCIKAAIYSARQHRSSLFIVANAQLVVKLLLRFLEMDGLDASERDAILDRIQVHETREIHILLSILHEQQVQHTASPHQVFLGPLCDLFASFFTTSGLTASGEGLLRMVHLACKHLQAARPDLAVCIIQASMPPRTTTE